MKDDIAGIIFKHGDDDFSLWIPELTTEENEELNTLLEKFATSGGSVRGTKKDILDEAQDCLR